MEILGKILGNVGRVKIMRLFLFNKNKAFKNKDIIKRSRVSSSLLRKELRLLVSVRFIKKSLSAPLAWCFNDLFKYTKEFESLLLKTENLSRTKLLDNFKKVGKVNVIIVSGVFIKNNDSRVDLLIVGDKMNRNKIEKGVHKLEAEIGVELVYAIFDTKEFIYRINMYDKLVRDILDYPHEVLLQAKELSTQILKKN